MLIYSNRRSVLSKVQQNMFFFGCAGNLVFISFGWGLPFLFWRYVQENIEFIRFAIWCRPFSFCLAALPSFMTLFGRALPVFHFPSCPIDWPATLSSVWRRGTKDNAYSFKRTPNSHTENAFLQNSGKHIRTLRTSLPQSVHFDSGRKILQ